MKSSIDEEDIGVLVGERLHVTQHCGLVSQRTSCVLGCIQVGSPQYKKDMDLLERAREGPLR